MNLLLGVLHRPSVEVSGLQVVTVEHLSQELLVRHIAEGIVHTGEVGDGYIVPAVLELIGASSATLTKAGVAHLSVMGEHESPRLQHSLMYSLILYASYTLIALTMVIGTYIKECMLMPVIPSQQSALILLEIGQSQGRGLFLPATHLGEEPTAADDGRGLEILHRASGLHLAAYHTGEIILHGYHIDSLKLVLIHQQA